MRNWKPILLVEDEHAEAIIIKRALNDLKINNPLIHLNNGEEVLLVLHAKPLTMRST